MFTGSLHPAVGVVEDGEGVLAMADLKLVLLLHHLNERGVPWGTREREREERSQRSGWGRKERRRIKVKGEEIRTIFEVRLTGNEGAFLGSSLSHVSGKRNFSKGICTCTPLVTQ